jgi:uncharacterized membrane protein YhaH (DUF805 family)
MNFEAAIRSCLNQYLGFTGRAARSEFWYFVLFNILMSIASSIVDWVLSAILGFGFVGFLVSLALLLPGIAVSIRRLHDIGKPGWWLLAMVPGLMLIFLAPVLGGLMVLGGAGLLLFFYVKPGTAGPNAYGPDPLAATPVAGVV